MVLKNLRTTPRERILDAAMHVFAQHGYRRASMEQVAEAAEFSRQAVYLHFENKQALFRAVVEAVHEGAYEAEADAGRAAEKAGKGLADIIAAQVEARFRYIVECLEESEEAEELLAEVLGQTSDLHRKFVEHNLGPQIATIKRVCKTNGLTLRGRMNAAELARCIQIAIRGFNDLRLGEDFIDDLGRVIRLIVAGALASAAPPTSRKRPSSARAPRKTKTARKPSRSRTGRGSS